MWMVFIIIVIFSSLVYIMWKSENDEYKRKEKIESLLSKGEDEK